MPGKPDATVTEREVLTLAKLLGMLGSDQVGERAAAALKAHQWIKARDLEWREVLLPEGPPAVSVQVKGAVPAEDMLRAEIAGWRQKVATLQHELDAAKRVIRAQEATAQATHTHAGAAQRPAGGAQPVWLPLARQFMQAHQGLLRGQREADFVDSQISRGLLYGAQTRVSDKQEAWLRDILGRAGMTW